MPRKLAAAALCALAAGLCSLGGEAPPPVSAAHAGERGGLAWERLVFEDANAITRVRTTIDVRTISAAEAQRALIPAPGGDGLPAGGDGAIELSADIEAENRIVADKAWRGRVWLRPDGTALQRIRDKRAPDLNRRIYRFTPAGVFRIRAQPEGASERGAAPEAWTDVTEKAFAYGAAAAGCPRVSDPAALLYLLSRAVPAPGRAPRAECVFNKKSLYRVAIQAAGGETVSAAHLDERGGEARPGAGSRRALRLQIVARPMGTPESDDVFEFLGIEGDVELLLEEATGLPLRIRGRVPDFGAADFALTAVRLAP